MNIVICGYPRSGSTMFYNMLRATAQGYHFTDKERSAVHALKECEWPVITKFPSDCFYRDEIMEIDPHVRWVVMIRDPRAVLCSKHPSTDNLYKVNWDKTFFGGLPSQRRFKKQNKPGRYRSHWGLIDWDKAIDNLPDPVFVRYESLVQRPHAEQWRLAQALGINFSSTFADFHKRDIPEKLRHQMNGVRPVETSRVESWRDHPGRIKAQFTECPHLHAIVMKRGYERDTQWIKQL
jgi:hypothetical protein